MTELRARSIGAFVISIHMPHTWHDLIPVYAAVRVHISIHMPHTWHDGKPCPRRPSFRHFNPHATYVA